MSKPMRKLRPSMPLWWRRNLDGCFFCRTRNNCNSCKTARADAKLLKQKKVKGRKPD